jgi:hypothetical protein
MDAQDYMTDSTGDLKITNGDFEVGFSDNEHQADIIISAPGYWKQYPLVGVFIDQYNKSNQRQELESSVRTQLAADGYRDLQITTKLDPNGKYIMTVNAQRI